MAGITDIERRSCDHRVTCFYLEWDLFIESWDRSVGVETSLRSGQQKYLVAFSEGAKYYFFFS
jgi:hypothetical protein